MAIAHFIAISRVYLGTNLSSNMIPVVIYLNTQWQRAQYIVNPLNVSKSPELYSGVSLCRMSLSLVLNFIHSHSQGLLV